MRKEEESAIEAFREELVAAGVSALEIVWGDYISHYHEVPGHLRERYLCHRRKLLHRDALARILDEEKERSHAQ